MSDTHKTEKGGRIKFPQNEDKRINNAIRDRNTYGSTEKILRRNRKIWTRLVNKIRRRIDKNQIEEGLDVSTQLHEES
jgi:phosphotransacetylase